MALSKIVENSLADSAVSSAKLKDFAAAVDLNGVELVLDADADTSITADTDDRIDFKIANVEHFSFSNSSGDTVIKPMVDAKDIKFQQYDGRTLLDINDGGFIGIANGATGAGAIRIFEDTDNGSNYVGLTAGSISSSFTLTLPTADGSAGNLLKTDGSGTLSFGSVALDDVGAGDAAVTLSTSSGNITIDATANDTDIIFKGTDNSSDITMLTLDGSDAGSATFNHDIILGNDSFVRFGDAGEKITGDGTDLTINSSNDLHLTATTDINIPANVGLTFGDDAEKIEGDGTDLTIAGNNINLTAVAYVNIPSGVGLTFATAEKIESDGTDLSITVGSIGDINIPANIGLTFGDDGEKIEGDGTDLTIAGNNINLTATADVVIPANVGITFGTGEKIEGDSTDLTVTSGAKINLTATSDVHIPNNVGIVFGGDSEKIEGDGTDMTISANNLTVDAAADIILDAAGNNLTFKSGGTSIFDISNSSSDVVLKPMVDTKDIIFQQYDGTEVMRIEDGAHASFAAAAVNPEATLSDGANVAWNVLTSPVAKVTLGGNRNLSAGSGGITGQFVSLLVIQDGTGSRTLTFNAVYEFTGDEAPTLTTTASKGDLFVFRYNGSKFLEVGRNLNLTLS